MRLRLLTCALALALLDAHAALAAPQPGVEVQVADGCQGVDRAQLSRLLRIEQRRDASAGVQQARVSVSCDGAAVTLQVEERGAAAVPRTRNLAAADVAGEVGARVLALAAIELLNQRAPEPEPEPEPAPQLRPQPEEPTPASASALAQQLVAPSVRLMAVGTVRSFGFEHPLAGGGLAVDYLRLSKLGLRLEFDVAVAERSYEFGSVHLQLATVSAQAGYLGLHESWLARAFVGYRFGSGRISGKTAVDGVPVGTVAGASGGPLVSGGFGLRSRSWVAELGAEAGLVSFPLEGLIGGDEPIALDRYWLGLSLNVGALL
ncbi:MAG TPA: hypothetical protein VHP33_26590 [Polyangiaceae bacterium]|nr:hypothetical protein [Polyangiaceae bacterium]